MGPYGNPQPSSNFNQCAVVCCRNLCWGCKEWYVYFITYVCLGILGAAYCICSSNNNGPGVHQIQLQTANQAQRMATCSESQTGLLWDPICRFWEFSSRIEFSFSNQVHYFWIMSVVAELSSQYSNHSWIINKFALQFVIFSALQGHCMQYVHECRNLRLKTFGKTEWLTTYSMYM